MPSLYISSLREKIYENNQNSLSDYSHNLIKKIKLLIKMMKMCIVNNPLSCIIQRIINILMSY